MSVRPAALVVLGVLLAGCDGPRVRSLDPLPDLPAGEPERTDAGNRVLTVRDGALVGLEGRWIQIPTRGAVFLIHHDGGGQDVEGEVPRAAFWARGRGARRHTLPQASSPVVNLDTTDEWRLKLAPGTYDVSLTLAGGVGELGEPMVLVVR